MHHNGRDIMDATNLINDAFDCGLTVAESLNGFVVVYGSAAGVRRWHLCNGLVADGGMLVDENGAQVGMVNGDHAAIRSN